MPSPWCHSAYAYRRRPTREVRIGDVGVGGANPIRVQSMTTPATSDVAATVSQIERLVAAGCEIVRVTVPTSNDARALPEIRKSLAARKIRVPLVADIHFSPGAALKAVEHVEKVRVNPGNYADRKQFAVREYTDGEYASELSRLAEAFRPLVLRAQQLGVAMRIGTNHGSLSDRIMNRYGDSPLGMVESALEFVRICEADGYRDLVVSMKSSNPVVTIEAYRLLAARMADEGMDYPFHLGVTEAGDGEDGRIKSAVGIGSLLDDGIGDTVRVSLTEDPVEEVPVAMRLVEPYNRWNATPDQGRSDSEPDIADIGDGADGADSGITFDPFAYARRASRVVRCGPVTIGGEHPVAVEVPLDAGALDERAIRAEIDAHAGPRVPAETRPEIVVTSARSMDEIAKLRTLRATMSLVAPGLALSVRLDGKTAIALLQEALARAGESKAAPFADRIQLGTGTLEEIKQELNLGPGALPALFGTALLIEGTAGELAGLLGGTSALEQIAVCVPGPVVHAASAGGTALDDTVRATRALASALEELGLDLPIVLAYDTRLASGDSMLASSVAIGSLLCDGIGDAVSLVGPGSQGARALAFNILQAARVRISKTEFISCPSCGRTLFDLEETTRRIKSRTAHLKGLKIAVMGCIVNGPGEMADADFGYVGWGTDKIALFVGKSMVAKDIPMTDADDRLVDLIKAHGKWQEPAAPVEA